MELINDLEMAANLVRQGADDQEKLKIINKLLDGEVNVETDAGKRLLHRRALLMSLLREKEIWGHPSNK